MKPDDRHEPVDDAIDELARALPQADLGSDEDTAARRDVLFAIARSRRRRVLAFRLGTVAAFVLAGVLTSLTVDRLRETSAPAPAAASGGVTRITQQTGRVTYDVAPRRPGERFVVQTPQADIEVRGTRFSVAVEGGETSVDVDHGRVEVREPGARAARAVLGSGEHTAIGRASPAPIVGAALPSSAQAIVPPVEVATAPAAAPAPPVTPRATSPAPSAAPDDDGAAVPPPALAPPSDASGAGEQAPQARRPDDGELRLFRAAHELHFQRGDLEGALHAWNRYLGAYPHGALAEEARYNRAVCLLRLGRDREANRDLSALASDPSAFRAREAKLLRAATLRRRGRCEEAEQLLEPLRRGNDEIARRAADLPPCR